MRRPVAAVVVTLAALAVVLLGTYLADGFARDSAQQAAVARVHAAVDDAQDLQVDVRGGLFLPQVLGRELARVDVRADAITVAGTTLHDVSATVRDIDLTEPVTAGDVVADAHVALAVLQRELDAATTGSPVPLTLAIEDGRLVADVAVLPVAAPLALTPDGSGVLVTLTDVRVGPVTMDAGTLAGLLGRDRPAMHVELPLRGLTVDRVEIEDAGLRLHVSGRRLSLDAGGLTR